MKNVIKNTVITLLLLGSQYSIGQTYDGMKGHGVYKKHDKSFITPDYRGKHSVSFGIVGTGNSAFTENYTPGYGVHLGYNYLIFRRRKKKRIASKKVKFHDEIKAGLGIHLGIINDKEFFFTAKYFYPILPIRGKLVSWYIFSEYGLGIHKLPTVVSPENELKMNFSLELFRIRFGKSPLNLNVTANYALSNNLFIKEPVDLGFIVGFRYYFYKKHKA